MRVSLLIQPKLDRNYGPQGRQRVMYATDPYNLAEGAVRAFQRFCAIALSTKGTDTLRPWLGTELPQLPRYNIHMVDEMKLFVRDQVRDAIKQFFILQREEQDSYAEEDIMTAIDIISIDINDRNKVTIQLRFTPQNLQGILLSLEV